MHHCGILDLADVYKFIDDDINGESGRGVYIQFAGDVPTMGGDGMDRDKETAARIAWAVLLRFYNNGINQNKYFRVGLRDSTTWVVEGCHRSKDEDENVTDLGVFLYGNE